MSIEAMKLALVALDIVQPYYTQNSHVKNAITALRTELERVKLVQTGVGIGKAEQQVTSLQCANCQATIESLNDRVMYLMGQAEQSVATNDTSQKRVDEIQKQRHDTTQPDRHALQAKGEHPAPCARHCEANAFKIEIRDMRRQITEWQEALSRKWVGLTDEEIESIRLSIVETPVDYCKHRYGWAIAFARAIEASHGIKENK